MLKTLLSRFSFRQIAGFLVFCISLTIYLITISLTVNFWDCGEFIACANNLEIGHAPGAPLYLILVRLLTIFARPNQVAFFVNLLSALASSFTIWFLYLSIGLILKIVHKSLNEKIITFSSVIASLTFAFTDSFWYSAIEAEVYALSLMFTSITIWAGLKWQSLYPKVECYRYLLLIAFLLGLSVGVHLLNLLTIPIIIYWVFIHVNKSNKLKHFLGLILGILVFLFIHYVVIQNGLWIAKKLELLFVNLLNFQVHSGLMMSVIAMYTVLCVGIAIVWKRNSLAHFVLLCIFLFTLGVSSYAIVIIRANVIPGLNFNNPNHTFSLASFINREQYENRPLLKGAWFGAQSIKLEPVYNYRLNEDDKYEKYKSDTKEVYRRDDEALFQRMYSSQFNHKIGYLLWSGLEDGEKPTWKHQLKYLIKYQIGHMYFRYFMWNFSGRQNHFQGHGDFMHGNFITGIPLFDKYMLGSRKHLHTKELKSYSRNVYFMIPLIFGIIGFLYLIRIRKWSLLIFISLLFLYTGILIVFYLNQPPFEPRERDYVFVGSFYTYSIFIALGVYVLIRKIIQLTSSHFINLMGIVLIVIALPGNILANNFNDHNRRNCYLARDLALGYLQSCKENSILFTYGDNDTYPLWYLQEVEGIRRDVRVVNIGLLSADWYIEHQQYAQKGCKPLSFTIPISRYKKGALDYATIINRKDDPISIKEGLLFLADTLSESRVSTLSGEKIDFLPSNKLSVNSQVNIKFNRSYLLKGEIALLDIIASNYQNRSIYFTKGTPKSAMQGFNKYTFDQGIVCKLTLTEKESSTEQLYNLLLNKLDIPKNSWWDQTSEDAVRLSGILESVIQLSNKLIDKEEIKRVRNILDKYHSLCYSVELTEDEKIKWLNLLLKVDLKIDALNYLNYFTNETIQNLYFYIDSRKYLGDNMLEYAKEEMQLLKTLRRIAEKEKITNSMAKIDEALNIKF